MRTDVNNKLILEKNDEHSNLLIKMSLSGGMSMSCLAGKTIR